MEKFKPIKDYPCYEVSNYGNVRSSKYKEQRILKPATGMKGYFYVNICNDEKKYKKHYIHRLVVTTFIRSMKDGEQVDHLNMDKKDNRLVNLQIVDNRINQLRKRKSILPGVSKSGNKWRSRIQHNNEIIFVGMFNTPEQAHKAYKNKLKEYGINIAFDKDMAYMLDDNTI
jgi:hypothetical protein